MPAIETLGACSGGSRGRAHERHTCWGVDPRSTVCLACQRQLCSPRELDAQQVGVPARVAYARSATRRTR